MKTISATVVSALVWLTLVLPTCTQQQQAGSESTPPVKGATGRSFSGRVVDGLGRPVSGVKVTVHDFHKFRGKVPDTILRTGDDGRYSGRLPTDDDAWLVFEKEDYGRRRIISRAGEAITLHRKWNRSRLLRYSHGEELDRGVREILASDEWANDDEELLGFLFDAQEDLRPALRRLIANTHVGPGARDWLDLLNDPDDHDLFPKGRRYGPKAEVKEIDLVEALRTTARQRSTAPEPFIDIDFIKFNRDLDRTLIQCGINRVAMTGVTWQFVFWKVGKQWELRSAKAAGIS